MPTIGRASESYAGPPDGLLDYYRTRGFTVAHVPVKDCKVPALNEAELAKAWTAFRELPKPVLVHCSAGVDRTGAAVKYIRAKLKAEKAPAA